MAGQREDQGARSQGRAGLRRGKAAWAGGAALLVLVVVGTVFATHRPPPQIASVPIPPAPVAAAPEPQAAESAPPAPVAEAPQPAATPPVPAVELPAWQRFAMPAQAAEGRPLVAVIIDDLGLNRALTERATRLAAPVTLSFFAYAGDLRQQTAAARDAGHELLVHVPMEPLASGADMGAEGLTTAQPRQEVLRRLRWDLDRFDSYVGINNHMGSKFTGDAQGMGWVIAELKSRGLLFIDSRTIAATTGPETARRLGLPYAERDVFLDNDQRPEAIAARLHDLEAAARKRGTAIGIGHPHTATLAALEAWIAALPEKGLVLVPVTEIVRVRAAAG